MKKLWEQMPDGYHETIENGINAVRFFNQGVCSDFLSREESVKKLKEVIIDADAIVIGAGAGLSTAAGLTYSGERFQKYFFDFAQRFGIRDMYSGGFYPFPDKETFWAWWARHIYYNRYIDAPKPVYNNLLKLVEGNTHTVERMTVNHDVTGSSPVGGAKKNTHYQQLVLMTQGVHPFPYRTRKLSPVVPKIVVW